MNRLKQWRIAFWSWNPRTMEYEPDVDDFIFKKEDAAHKKYDSMQATEDIAKIELIEEILDRGGWVVRRKRIAVKDTAGEVDEGDFDTYDE